MIGKYCHEGVGNRGYDEISKFVKKKLEKKKSRTLTRIACAYKKNETSVNVNVNVNDNPTKL